MDTQRNFVQIQDACANVFDVSSLLAMHNDFRSTFTLTLHSLLRYQVEEKKLGNDKGSLSVVLCFRRFAYSPLSDLSSTQPSVLPNQSNCLRQQVQRPGGPGNRWDPRGRWHAHPSGALQQFDIQVFRVRVRVDVMINVGAGSNRPFTQIFFTTSKFASSAKYLREDKIRHQHGHWGSNQRGKVSQLSVLPNC